MVRRPTPIAGQISHITIRCNNKNFLLNLDKTYFDLVSWFNCFPLFFNVHLHHVLFMSNHMHFLVTPQENNMGQAMSYVLSNISKYLNYKNKTINHNFGSRYYPTVITDEKHLINVIKYIYQNPIQANMVNQSYNYRYSTLAQHIGLTHDGFILKQDPYTQNLFDHGLTGRELWLNSINEIFTEDERLEMDQCLTRSRFKFTLRQQRNLVNQKTSLIL